MSFCSDLQNKEVSYMACSNVLYFTLSCYLLILLDQDNSKWKCTYTMLFVFLQYLLRTLQQLRSENDIALQLAKFVIFFLFIILTHVHIIMLSSTTKFCSPNNVIILFIKTLPRLWNRTCAPLNQCCRLKFYFNTKRHLSETID